MDRARPLNRTARPKAAPPARAQAGRVPNLRVHAAASSMSLAVVLGAGDAPPSEFRLFVAGWNETENGRFLFDEDAAKATMSAYAKWGVDLAIDLEHQMLVEEIAPDPTAKDARGWCNLELRPDGSLWAVNVTWTPDGASRLTEKRQRYVSPAFAYDIESLRVTQILNVAITAMPATHNTPALMAASRGIATMAASGDLSPKLVSAALEAVASKDSKGGLDLLKQILAALLGGGDPEDAPPPAGDGGADDATEAPAAAAADVTKDKETMAAARVAIALTGKADAGEAMAELARRSRVAVEIESREAQLSADRASLEASERDSLTVEIASSMSPAVAWADPIGATDRATRKPSEPFASMPIASLRTFVAKLKSSAGAGARPSPAPAGPAGKGSAPPALAKLSAAQIKMCEETGCKPEVFAALQAQRDSAKTEGT